MIKDKYRGIKNYVSGARMIFVLCYLLFLTAPIRAQYKVVHLEKPFNTQYSETGALRIGDTIIAYTSYKETPTDNSSFDWNSREMNVMQARIMKSGKVARPKLSRWGLNARRYLTGNIAIDPLSNDIYFTRAKNNDPEMRCEIYYCRKKKRGWEEPVRLSGDVNMAGYTSTQPTIGRLKDGMAILYFSSNRPGGMGGNDIWYTIVNNGHSKECVNLGPGVNTADNEITPFYDQRNEALYFSSDREGGQGGYDIYCAVGQRNTWQKAQIVCECLNSKYNDIYYTICDYDSATGIPTGGYLTSNRPDSYFVTDSTCCNDIYQWGIDTAQLMQRMVAIDTVESIGTIVERVRHFEFPLFLYFHNDEPDPTCNKETTTTGYNECQMHLASLRNEYMMHQTDAQDSALMNEFFDSCVEGNFRRVEQLFEYIESLLEDGQKVTITIAGYASPVFRSEYNQALSARRIGSFINMVRAWRDGVFDEAMANGKLFVRQEPHGAVQPTTESQSKDQVYGLPAAIARRIEILKCEIK